MALGPEIDISVSKLHGFETFANFWRVSVSVSENLVSEKKSISVSKNLVSGKKSFGFGKLGLGKEKNQNNKKETRPSKQCKSLI